MSYSDDKLGPLEHQPWLVEDLERLNIRRGDRVIQLTAQARPQTHAILELLGPDGTLLVVEPDRYAADRVRAFDHLGLTVLAYEPGGEERFGMFDAMLACPTKLNDWPLDTWGQLACANLRPGGRFVVDLPGEPLCDVLAEAWQSIGGDEEALKVWRGPSEAELAESLQRLGLRTVEGVIGTHLMHIDSAHALARFAGESLGCDDEIVDRLHHVIAERLGTTGRSDVLFRRTRVHGMR